MKRKKLISRVTPATASVEALRAMADHKAMGYRITNMKETLCNSAVAFQALEGGGYAVDAALSEKIGKRALLVFGYALSHANQCLICGNYFKKFLIDQGIDWDTFQFTEEEGDLIEFADALGTNPNEVPDEVYEKLQARYDDETLVLVVVNACFLLANNYFNNIVGTELDDYLMPYADK